MQRVIAWHASSDKDDLIAFQREQKIVPSQIIGISYEGLRWVLWYWKIVR